MAAGAAVVFTGAGVAAGVFAAGVCDCVVPVPVDLVALGVFVELLAELLVELFGVADVVAAELGVVDVVASGVEAGVEVGDVAVPGRAIGELCVEVNCGGVTAKTAPSPPTVPVAISIARFISVPSLNNL